MRNHRHLSLARRGSAVVEFAIAFGLLLTIFAGVWQFGYAFYTYNQLESAVRNGARYGSLATYDGGAWQGTTFQARVKNMVVYGKTSPAVSDTPIAPGLTTANVRITIVFNGVVPKQVQVDVVDYQINTFFVKFPLSGKPRCTFDYMGRFTTPV
jgi:Flp pilus assembly protein TadG